MKKLILELQVTFEDGARYTEITSEMNRAELFVFAMDQHKENLEKIETIHIEELQDRDVLLSRRAKKTHTIDANGTHTVCGEFIDYLTAEIQGTRFRCEKCGN